MKSYHGDAKPAVGERSIVGHSHQPWRPGRVRLFLWRIFRPALYRRWTVPIQVGHVTLPNFGYNVNGGEWIDARHILARAGGEGCWPDEARCAACRLRDCSCEGVFLGYHGDARPHGVQLEDFREAVRLTQESASMRRRR